MKSSGVEPFFPKLLQGEIFLFIAALARLDRAEPMNDAHYNVTNYAWGGTKLNHFMYTPKRSCQEHKAAIYR